MEDVLIFGGHPDLTASRSKRRGSLQDLHLLPHDFAHPGNGNEGGYIGTHTHILSLSGEAMGISVGLYADQGTRQSSKVPYFARGGSNKFLLPPKPHPHSILSKTTIAQESGDKDDLAGLVQLR